jgi:hypothetical protein
MSGKSIECYDLSYRRPQSTVNAARNFAILCCMIIYGAVRENFAAKHTNAHVVMRWILGVLTFSEDRKPHVDAPTGFEPAIPVLELTKILRPL